MKQMSRPVAAVLFMTALLALPRLAGADSSAAASGDWTTKVDPWVLKTAASGDTEFLVVLEAQADVSQAQNLAERGERGAWVFTTLRDVATATQGPILADLATRGVAYRPYWIANMIWVRGGMDTVRAMAERPDVRRVSANPSVPLQRPTITKEVAPKTPDTVEWNITKVGAPTVWAMGITGQGVTIAGQDTGYDWTHPALKPHYRGWDGANANHNYNWHDAIHSGGGVCGANSTQPCDDDAHGTHTMGTMVGDDGAGNQVGMAPGAKWIGCRNMNQGVGTPATYSECFQWFIAPTDLAGNNPDPTKAPYVISNSWGCPASEGCTDPNVLHTVVQNTVAAGIAVVVAAGNSGSSCSTVTDPASIYAEVFTVGATDSSDTIAYFSSRGPVTVDGSGRLKPEISAPGVNIRSSVPGGGYQGGWDGTSMATPHVAGAVALLLSATPSLIHHPDQIRTALEQSAVPRTTSQTCGGVPGSQIPNNTYGYGRLDIAAAIASADVSVSIADAPDPVGLGGTLTYKLWAGNSGPITATGVTIVDTLPANVTFVSASPGCANASGTVTCTVGTLLKGSVVGSTVVVTPTAEGVLTNTATISADQSDPQPSNNTAVAHTTVADSADLALALTDSPDAVLLGADLTYTATVTNGGPGASTPTAVVTLPASASFVSASPGCANASGTVTCSFASLASGGNTSATIVARPSAAGLITATALVSGTLIDPSTGNNASVATTTVVAATAAGLAVDAHTGGGTVSNGNGILEPGETVQVEPSWTNPSAGAATVGGSAVFSGPGSATYSTPDGLASYGSIPAGATHSCLDGGDCYVISVSDGPRPAKHWDATLTESLSAGGGGTWTVHVGNSFSDVAVDNWAYPFVETLLHHTITLGCSTTDPLYCPGRSVRRDEMAGFLARSLMGGDENVPTSGTIDGYGSYNCSATDGVSLFGDVSPTDWFCPHVHRILAAGITLGCGVDTLLYCPPDPVGRGPMAAFIARAMAGSDAAVPIAYTDPDSGRSYDCTPGNANLYFNDITTGDWFCKHAHYLWARQVIDGCDSANHLYCPDAPVIRDEMAKFLTNGFHLKLY